MKNTNLTLLLVLVVGNLAFSQNGDYAFKVLANKGINEFKSGDAWQQIRTGSSLKADDEIKVADNSYIGLVHATGKPLEIRQAGNYKVADLASKIKTGSSVLNKYTDFILSSTAEEKKNRLSATGAVHRGDADVKPIQLLLPDAAHSGLLGNTAFVSWEGSSVKGPYQVVINNRLDEEIFRFETPEQSFFLDMSTPKFASESAVMITVKSVANPHESSKEYMIKKVTSVESENVKKELEKMGPEIKDESALNKWILGQFYEENRLFIDAFTAFEQAHKLAPDVPEYEQAYQEFMQRHAYKK
jgi:hypothetical protein